MTQEVLAGADGSIVSGAHVVRLAASVSSASSSDSSDSGSGSSDNSGADLSTSGLISSKAEYTKDELSEALKTEQETLRDKKLDLQEAELNLRLAEKAVNEGEIKANMDGVVKTVGDLENPETGTPFITVSATKGLYIKSALPEVYYDKYHEGDHISVISYDTGNTYDAVIKDISDYPDTSGYYTNYNFGSDISYYIFTAEISEGGDDLTNDGYVSITLGGSSESEIDYESDDLYLWKAFILEEDGRKYVYKRGDNGKLVKTEITVGELKGQGYLVKSGVTNDDWIAFPGSAKEGAKTRETTIDEMYSET